MKLIATTALALGLAATALGANAAVYGELPYYSGVAYLTSETLAPQAGSVAGIAAANQLGSPLINNEVGQQTFGAVMSTRTREEVRREARERGRPEPLYLP